MTIFEWLGLPVRLVLGTVALFMLGLIYAFMEMLRIENELEKDDFYVILRWIVAKPVEPSGGKR